MNHALLVAPVLVPLCSLLLAIILRRHLQAVRVLSLSGTALLLAVGLVLVWQAAQGVVLSGQVGNWQAPFGISLVIDRLSAVMIAISALVALVTLLYGVAKDNDSKIGRDFHLFIQGLLTGICGAFITADIFNLYVWFEVLLIASFALMALGGGSRRLAGSMTYVALNLFATLIFLLSAGLVYGASGTLNMGELAVIMRSGEAPPGVTPALLLMLLSFAIKAALFPVFGWLPATYHVALTAVSAMFAGLLTKVGVYALIRLVTLLWPEYGLPHQLLLWVACATMLVGVLGAAAQTEVRRILSFHIVSQVGYMILGLALATPLALAGAVFYLIHHIVVKANLFFIGGLAARICGSERLADMGGLYKRMPWLALLFAIPALSLAGIPPLSGFWAKFLLVKASLDAAAWWAAGIALLTGVFTLLSMNKIWNEAFLKPHPGGEEALQTVTGIRAAWLGMSALALLTVLIGLGAGPLIDYAVAAAAQLADPQAYLQPFTGAGGI
ncbi:proton-conducting transporter membrane subunit [Pseudomonas chengduensis]|jgi:multicomponent Na+:H+ antiporter subunit D|uniref:proton-conducting transporter transmembrane domain-containing protein n=1 Tax=Ectopseudomonas oleovorans TaxID=301 RepID=UPI0005040EFD|nr:MULTISPECIES: proton-conducting transporter membrane subunit [Pseudomonas]KFJ90425.1 NADH/ubiquinone/plastoquinone [Pseudomonas sp. 1-7]MAE22528.1 Na+/H+ antiporter subunit D [Pseudomonas sp.]APU29583.1 NADH/ubiquinone/plastoquinone [Pseudomonas alcaliphila JAB1]MDH0625164.1 proton-conducting transporter membrane subunit [Pseudomonas chengduensis]MDH1213424.1 proton-conducting transporter membrane subunit [Pseudomonas chengduensis]|tara:strand:- start:250 stop:1746 length:1497 start_codon:yes stop_codon:yes gene_type:complete